VAILAATPQAIARAAAEIRRGGVVAFPTETVYGLGADAGNAAAAARVFEIKRRPAFDPLIVHLRGAGELERLVETVPDSARRLAERFWPGPLTLVLRKRSSVPDIVTAGRPTVAVRVPDHPVAGELLRRAGVPIAAPSANLSGRISPTTAEHVRAQLGERVPVILDGGQCRVGVESTIVSFGAGEAQILRSGGISVEEVEEVVGPVSRPSGEAPAGPQHRLRSRPDPRLPLRIVRHADAVPPADRAGAALLVCLPATIPPGFAHIEVLTEDGDLRRAAANLFGALHRLAAAKYANIYAVAVPEEGLGLAIMDRLTRAAPS